VWHSLARRAQAAHPAKKAHTGFAHISILSSGGEFLGSVCSRPDASATTGFSWMRATRNTESVALRSQLLGLRRNCVCDLVDLTRWPEDFDTVWLHHGIRSTSTAKVCIAGRGRRLRRRRVKHVGIGMCSHERAPGGQLPRIMEYALTGFTARANAMKRDRNVSRTAFHEQGAMLKSCLPGGLCRRLNVECQYREPLPTKSVSFGWRI